MNSDSIRAGRNLEQLAGKIIDSAYRGRGIAPSFDPTTLIPIFIQLFSSCFGNSARQARVAKRSGPFARWALFNEFVDRGFDWQEAGWMTNASFEYANDASKDDLEVVIDQIKDAGEVLGMSNRD